MTSNSSKIQILLTGGTIDKHYNQSNGKMEFAESHISDILQQGRNRSDIDINEIIFKDSLDMTEEDLHNIAANCISSSPDKILITHGTDTMVDTACFLANKYTHLKDEKCIILVGAMIPFEISYSDATFNIGFALGALNALPTGIFIAMNGKIFSWDDVQKNRQLGEFQTI